jgi:ABC-2 type transport system ATP-binding protein
MTRLKVTNVGLLYPLTTDQHYSLKHALLGIGDQKLRNNTSLRRALSKISFDLVDGDRLGVIGTNGAGKSTLLRILSGIYPPTEGFVQISGRVTALLDFAAGVDIDMSGWDNIKLRLLLLGCNGPDHDDLVREAGEFSELGERLNLPIRTYSTGMFVRLAFAVCTVVKPEILILDEFLGAGDINFVAKANKRMEDMIAEGAIVIIASHALHSIRSTCNKVLWLDNGKVRMLGETESVIAAYEDPANHQA